MDLVDFIEKSCDKTLLSWQKKLIRLIDDLQVISYALDSYDKETKTRVFYAESMESVSKLLEVVGVDKWEDLPGKYIRFEDNGWGSIITKIGNIVEDKWFDLKEFFGKVGKTYGC